MLTRPSIAWLVRNMTNEDMLRLAQATVNSEDKVLARMSRRLIRLHEKSAKMDEEIARLKEEEARMLKELGYMKNKRGVQ